VVQKSDEDAASKSDLYQPLTQAARLYCEALLGPAGKPARAYLAQRGFTGPQVRTLLKTFGVGCTLPGFLHKMKQVAADTLEVCGLTVTKPSGDVRPYFIDRLMFPLRDGQGRTRGFGARTLGKSRVKYLNSPDTPLFSKQDYLYGLFEARKNRALATKPLVLVEGYFDVIALQLAGVARGVASLGTAVTEGHIRKLFGISSRALVCFDGDEAGHRATLGLAVSALPYITAQRTLGFVRLPHGEDPHSLVQKGRLGELQQALGTPVSLEQTVFEALCAAHPLETPAGRTLARRTLDTWTKQIPEADLRRSYQQALRDRLWRRLKGEATPSSVTRAPSDARAMQEKAFLATCLHHPELAHTHAEVLAALELSPLLEALRQGLLAWIASEEVVQEQQALRQRLVEQGLASPLEALEHTPTLFDLAPFALRDASLEEAQRGLVDLIRCFEHNELAGQELKEAEAHFAETLHEKDWVRLKHLRQARAFPTEM